MNSATLLVAAGGWLDSGGIGPSVIDDPSSPSGGPVQQITRATSGGDYFSPWQPIVPGRSYCLQTAIKWVGGGAPFVGTQFPDGQVVWVVGLAGYSDVFGPVAPLSATDAGWQLRQFTVPVPADVTQIRFVTELFSGGVKGGDNLASFDHVALLDGACAGGSSMVYSQMFESGTAGWADLQGNSPELASNDASQAGPGVIRVTRAASGGDYFSPWIPLAGERIYCATAALKWAGTGAMPFIGLQHSPSGPVWLVGAGGYTDVFGPVLVVSSGTPDWQVFHYTVSMPLDATSARFAVELFGGAVGPGAHDAIFDGFSLAAGPCSEPGVPPLIYDLPYGESFENGAGAWADKAGVQATLAADATSPSGSMVHQITRATSGGDWYSPFLNVTGGQTYCVAARVRWIGGGWPFIGIERPNSWIDWLIGMPSYMDPTFGTVSEVNASDTGWQSFQREILLPEGTTQMRLASELYSGAGKPGAHLAYLDGYGVTAGPCPGPASDAGAAPDAASPDVKTDTISDTSLDGGGSLGCLIDDNCNDGNPCTIDACVDHVCTNTVASCDDGNLDTVDQCVDGYCQHTGPFLTTKMFRKGQNAYAGVSDTQISENAPTTNYGAATVLSVDGDEPSSSGKDVASLIRWADLGIPSDATVTGASITLYIGGATSASSASAYSVYALNRTWDAAQATWALASTGVTWATNGAQGALDRDSTSLAATPTTTGGSASFSFNAAGISELQSWVSNPAENHGLILANASHSDGLSFYSSEYSNVSYRPMLSITYRAVQTRVDAFPVGSGHGSTEPKYGFFVYSDSHVEAATNLPFSTALAQMQTIMTAPGAPPTIAAISIGDHTENGLDPSWDWHMDLTESYWNPAATGFAGTLPRYLAMPGNHDVLDASNWYTTWSEHYPGLSSIDSSTDPAPRFSKDGVYYRFTYENALFIGLDTNKATNTNTSHTNDPQIQLLRSTLSSSTSRFKFMFYHMPAFYCGNGGTGSTPAAVAYVDLAAQNNVDVVFNGHSHVYARSCRMTKDHVCTGDTSGTVLLQVGTVGATDARLRAVKTTPSSVTGYDASGVSSPLNFTCNSAGGYAATMGSQRTFCYVNVQGCSATVSCYKVGDMTPIDTLTLDRCP